LPKYRNNLPQLSGDLFLTDGGLETILTFHHGIELPYFAAFDLLKHEKGTETLRKYFGTYAGIASKYQVGFILESPTWRANFDWGKKLGYSRKELSDINHKAVELVEGIRKEYENKKIKTVISGCIGPQGDGYIPTDKLTEKEAERYHLQQIETFCETDADMVTAISMNYVEEAIGIARAAKLANIPVVISFTVETDCTLPTGSTLKDAIEKVDQVTENAPAYYMINCAHPTHFEKVLGANEAWVQRIRGIRANASTKSHAELNKAKVLDDGNPIELGSQYRELRKRLRNLNVLGGCCGTDHRHIEEICKACVPLL